MDGSDQDIGGLMTFYGVDSERELIEAMDLHIGTLQARLRVYESQLQAKDAEIAGLTSKLESAEALLYKKNCAIGRADTTIQTLTHANARLLECLVKAVKAWRKQTGPRESMHFRAIMRETEKLAMEEGAAQHALTDTEGEKGA